MNKLITISSLFLTLSTASFAMSSLPNGNWSGGGKWTASTGKSGDYTETVSVKDNAIAKSVTVDGKTWTMKATVTFDKNNFVTCEGTATSPDGKTEQVKSEGFCATTLNACTFYSGHAKMHFGGTVGFGKTNLYELGGAKEGNGVKVHWDGTLTPVTEE